VSVPDNKVQRAYRVRISLFLLAVGLALVVWVVAYQAVQTLKVLDEVERERDRWQQAGPAIEALKLKDGSIVADIGSGAGYFTFKLAPAVGNKGLVIAEDIVREPLAFLRIRALLRHQRNIQVIHGEPDNPHLQEGRFDAVLVANTYHEFMHPRAVLKRTLQALHPGGRLVILDRGPLQGEEESGGVEALHHERDPSEVEAELRETGFELISRNDHFIERPTPERPGDRTDNHLWRLIVAMKP
jgi:ubiquinone/menaquinone biosynthesis C-methylase UbiE